MSKKLVLDECICWKCLEEYFGIEEWCVIDG